MRRRRHLCRRHSCRRAWPLPAIATALVLLLLAAPAQAEAQPPGIAGSQSDAACDPEVAEALAGSAQAGVEADLAVLRHPDQGIRNPDSILDFSCITDLFDYRSFDIHFDPAGALEQILDLARRRICAAARDAYRRYVGRALDPSVYLSEYTRPLDRLPGLDVDWERRRVIDDLSGNGDAGPFRDAVGGGQ